MATSLMEDAFAHHIWATLELIDACAPLSEDQLRLIAAWIDGGALR